MPNLGYTLGIPDGPNNPSEDQPDMKINNDSNASIWNVDHFGFNNNNGGYHSDIHLVTQNDPVNFAGGVQLYAKLDATTNIPVLFSKAGNGAVVQMYLSNLTNPGYSWVSGFLIQFGTTTVAGAVVFAIPFTTIVNVQITPIVVGATTSKIIAYAASVTTTGFTISVNGTGVTTGYNFYWMAMGG